MIPIRYMHHYVYGTEKIYLQDFLKIMKRFKKNLVCNELMTMCTLLYQLL